MHRLLCGNVLVLVLCISLGSDDIGRSLNSLQYIEGD